jgi:hypothetical protein
MYLPRIHTSIQTSISFSKKCKTKSAVYLEVFSQSVTKKALAIGSIFVLSCVFSMFCKINYCSQCNISRTCCPGRTNWPAAWSTCPTSASSTAISQPETSSSQKTTSSRSATLASQRTCTQIQTIRKSQAYVAEYAALEKGCQLEI